ncbi:MAG: UvrD-helicase domain-containing protein, partial [Candidatus Aenigmatarchaeota archaeon]
MTNNSPNPEQKELIESKEGIYLVDAGAGTGKTFTITRRYANILEEEDVEPDDILLITFTNNAADQMQERIINHCSYEVSELKNAPISTFHSLCRKILEKHGFSAPKILGIDDEISRVQVMENQVLERQEFRNFINDFIEDHPEYRDFYRILGEKEE